MLSALCALLISRDVSMNKNIHQHSQKYQKPAFTELFPLAKVHKSNNSNSNNNNNNKHISFSNSDRMDKMSLLQYKSQSGMKNWTRKYCKIVNDGGSDNWCIMCYDDEELKKLYVRINLTGLVLGVAETDRKGWFYFTIDLIEPIGKLRRKRRHHCFRTKSKEERSTWVSNIRKCSNESNFISMNDQYLVEQTVSLVTGGSLMPSSTSAFDNDKRSRTRTTMTTTINANGINDSDNNNRNKDHPRLRQDDEHAFDDDDDDANDGNEDMKSFSSLSSSSDEEEDDEDDDDDQDDESDGIHSHNRVNKDSSNNNNSNNSSNSSSGGSSPESSKIHGLSIIPVNQSIAAGRSSSVFDASYPDLDIPNRANDAFLHNLFDELSVIRFAFQDDENGDSSSHNTSPKSSLITVDRLAQSTATDDDGNDDASQPKRKPRSLATAFSRIKASIRSHSVPQPSQVSSSTTATSTTVVSNSTPVTSNQDASEIENNGENQNGNGKYKIINIVETDQVEVFQNQRWLPISKWGSKMLLHDRAAYTDRSGRKMEKFYNQTLNKDNDTSTANAESIKVPDEDEGIENGSGRIVKLTNWTWSDPEWKVEQLPCLVDHDGNSNNNVTSPQNPTANGNGDTNDQFGSPLVVIHRKSVKDAQDESLLSVDVHDSKEIGSNEKRMKSRRSASMTRRDTADGTASIVSAKDENVDRTWATGTEFDFIDNAIARGMPGAEGRRENVRTRRLIRERIRTIQIQVPNESTDELTEAKTNPLSFAKVINPSTYVPIKGWLGKKGQYGTWSIRYVRLRVSIPESLFALEFFDTKSKRRLRNRILLGPDDSCRMLSDINALILSSQTKGSDSLSLSTQQGATSTSSSTGTNATTAPATLATNLMNSSLSNGSNGSSVAYASPRSSKGTPRRYSKSGDVSPHRENGQKHKNSLGDEGTTTIKSFTPQEGRFELVLRKCAHRDRQIQMILNADDEKTGRAWVAAINQVLSLVREKNSKSLLPPLISPKVQPLPVPNDRVSSHSDGESSISPQGPTPIKIEKKKKNKMLAGIRGIATKIGLMHKNQTSEENEANVEKEDISSDIAVDIPDTQEEPVPGVLKDGFSIDSLSDQALSKDGELVEMMRTDFPPGVNLRTIFQHILGDDERALVYLPHIHRDNGDSEIVTDKWRILGDDESDEYPAYRICGNPINTRLLSFRIKTNVSIGPSTTRVKKLQQYCYFEKEKVLVWQHIAKSLDIPYGDCFSINERWVFRQNADGKCSAVVFLAPIWTKSPMLKNIITVSIMNGSKIQFSKIKQRILSAFTKKGSKNGESQPNELAAETAESGTNSITASGSSNISAMLSSMIKDVDKTTMIAILLFLVLITQIMAIRSQSVMIEEIRRLRELNERCKE